MTDIAQIAAGLSEEAVTALVSGISRLPSATVELSVAGLSDHTLCPDDQLAYIIKPRPTGLAVRAHLAERAE